MMLLVALSFVTAASSTQIVSFHERVFCLCPAFR